MTGDKVWLLTSGDGSDGDEWTLHQIFRTKEEADKEKLKYSGLDYRVEEWDVEEAATPALTAGDRAARRSMHSEADAWWWAEGAVMHCGREELARRGFRRGWDAARAGGVAAAPSPAATPSADDKRHSQHNTMGGDNAPYV